MKLIFTRGPLLGLRAVIVVYPMQWLMDLPLRAGQWVHMDILGHHALLLENEQLRTQQLLLQARLQSLLIVEQENQQLHHLLQSAEHVPGQVKVARIMAVQLNAALQEAVINLGQKDGVFVGQPVLDAEGVMGQVIDVGSLVSTVLLATDGRSAIPVQDFSSGLQAIAVGAGYDRLQLINVTKTSPVQMGDLFVCSGLAGRFPVGYPVGIVTQIANIPEERFSVITLKPSAQLYRSMEVLLIWPADVQLQGVVSKQLERALAASS